MNVRQGKAKFFIVSHGPPGAPEGRFLEFGDVYHYLTGSNTWSEDIGDAKLFGEGDARKIIAWKEELGVPCKALHAQFLMMLATQGDEARRDLLKRLERQGGSF